MSAPEANQRRKYFVRRVALVLAFLLLAAPDGEGEIFHINSLMDAMSQSHNLTDLIDRMTHLRRPTQFGIFFATGSELVNPDNPQVMFRTGNALFAYGTHNFFEGFIPTQSHGTIKIQIEEVNGRLVINGDPALTPNAIRAMHTPAIIQSTTSFAGRNCVRCHLLPDRRMIEPSEQGRRYELGEDAQFRTPEQRREFEAALDRIFRRFSTNERFRNNPRFRWLYEQPQVAARGGQLLPSDTFTYRELVRTIISDTAHDLFRELTEEPRYAGLEASFLAALGNHDDFFGILAEQTHGEVAPLQAEFSRLRRQHAEDILRHFRARHRETTSWVLGGGTAEGRTPFERANYFLLNRAAISAIGPEILNMIVTDEEYARLSPADQARRIPLSELAIRDRAEIARIANSTEAVYAANARARLGMVLRRITGSEKKANFYLSVSQKVTPESGGSGSSLLDFYLLEISRRAGLRLPANERDITVLRGQVAALTRLTLMQITSMICKDIYRRANNGP